MSTRRRVRGEESTGADTISPATRRLRAQTETVRELLPVSLVEQSQPSPIPTTTNEINIISRVVRLTSDNITYAGAKAFQLFINGSANISIAERNSFIDIGAKFLLRFLFDVSDETWEQYSHEIFFQMFIDYNITSSKEKRGNVS